MKECVICRTFEGMPFKPQSIPDLPDLAWQTPIHFHIQVQTLPNKAATRCFLGTITYLSKFCPRLSEVVCPLCDLTHIDQKFLWADQHTALRQAKELVSQALCLCYFDVKAPVVLQVDTSEYGLGTALLQPATYSLTQRLFGRALHSNLPQLLVTLESSKLQCDTVVTKHLHRNLPQKQAYNKHAGQLLPDFPPGSYVYARPPPN